MKAIQRLRCGPWVAFLLALGSVQAAAGGTTVVALGASNTFGKGVARNQSYSAQLETLLRAAGHPVRVINAGINGDTTRGMLARLDRAVPPGTRVVILQPGGNDVRHGIGGERDANVAAIEQKLAARGIRTVIIENRMLRDLPHQPDGMHLTPEGYRGLAQQVLPQVRAGL